MTFGQPYAAAPWPMVSVLGPWGLTGNETASNTTPASAAYESAQRAVYFPITVPIVCVAKRVWWANGATTTGGATIEVGIYSDGPYKPSTKLISGSATQGTANQIQFVDVTDTTLAPGRYWLAILSSSATNTTLFRSAGGLGAIMSTVKFLEAGLGSLPTTATPAVSTGTSVWVFGFSTTTIT